VDDIPMPRINYAGITKFPIQKGEEAKAFVCFHNTNGSEFNGKINLELKDKEGNIIASKEYQGNITGEVMVETADIGAGQNLNLFNLESELSDDNGKVIDSFSGSYDISKLSPGYIEETSEENNAGIYIVLFLLLTAVILSFYFLKKRKSKPIFIFVLLLVGISLIYLIGDGKRETEITKAEEGVGNFSQTIGRYGIMKEAAVRQRPCQALSFGGLLEVNYEIFLKQGDKILKNGDKIDSSKPIEFVFNKNGEWFGFGNRYDTPPPYWIDSELYPINDPRTMDNFYSLPEKGCGDINEFYISGRFIPPLRAPLIIQNPNYQLNASDNVNCVENNCQITGTGNVSITAIIDKTYFQQIMAYKGYPNGGDCHYYTEYEINKMRLPWGYRVYGQYYDKLPIESVSKTWNFIVEDSGGSSPVAQIQCSVSNCATFKNESFALLNNSFDDKTPDDKLKSVWIVTGTDNQFYQRTECENKCDYTTQNLPIGDYSAYLRVEDEDELSDETTKNFKIKKDMEIEFECSLDNLNWENCSSIAVLSGQEVFFKDISKPSEGANIIARNWTFEDGNPFENKGNNEINPSTSFTIVEKKEEKEVTLAIKDSAGREKTLTENIEVFLTEGDVLKAMPNWREVSPKW
jgi:hypothetical protein